MHYTETVYNLKSNIFTKNQKLLVLIVIAAVVAKGRLPPTTCDIWIMHYTKTVCHYELKILKII